MQRRDMTFAIIILDIFMIIMTIKLWYQDIPLYMKATFTCITLPIILFLTLIVYGKYKK